MDFGRVKDPFKIDFTLPSDLPVNAKLLEKVSARGKTKVFIGSPVWGEKSWVGKIYPPKTRSTDFLHCYAKQFNSIELNASHYRVPTPSTVRAWKEATPADFRFSPKIPKVISHDARLVNASSLTYAFCEVMQLLEDRLGMMFLQVPPNFTPNEFSALENFVKEFPEHLQLAVELRHEGWFEPEVMKRTFAMLEENGISTVITDVAGRRDVLHMRLTTAKAFIRFTANDLHPTDFPRMDAWVVRLKEWMDMGLEELYFFLHNPDHLLCPEVTAYMINKLNEVCGLDIPPVKFYNEDTQQSLF